eukprot:GGOE01017853.1.p1 GENE.GGOE01017853.1~~GGOE01017853.1.p1  ORF type:complete len:1536 (-),score=439.18 GGOE01017853.1:188-4795(-)
MGSTPSRPSMLATLPELTVDTSEVDSSTGGSLSHRRGLILLTPKGSRQSSPARSPQPGDASLSSPSPSRSPSPSPQSRMQLDGGNFHTFHGDRFRLQGAPRLPSLLDWLHSLPTVKPDFFSTALVQDFLEAFDRHKAMIRSILALPWREQVNSFAERVRASKLKEKRPPPNDAALRSQIAALHLDCHPISDDDLLAIFVYTQSIRDQNGHLYPHQIFEEFNHFCRTFAHLKETDRDWPTLEGQWHRLWQPLANHLTQTLQKLPRVSGVFYRGGGFFVDPKYYQVGRRGSWGGFVSASSDRVEALYFVSKDKQMRATKGAYFIIVSDEAHALFHLSAFPNELEHLHPLAQEFQVCTVVPVSILQMLSLSVNVITLKRAGHRLSLDLQLRALDELGFIFEPFLSTYIPPMTKESPFAPETFRVEPRVQAFLEDPTKRLMLIAATSGMGKTSCALWATSQAKAWGRIGLFVSLPSLGVTPFTLETLVPHLQRTFDFDVEAMAELRQKPLLLILDSLDEATGEEVDLGDVAWSPSAFQGWDVKIIVTCREEYLMDHHRCLVEDVPTLFLQEFSYRDIWQYVRRRLPGMETPLSLDPPVDPPPMLDVSWSIGESVTIKSEAQAILAQIQASRFRGLYSVPFMLKMGMDLYMAGQTDTFHTTHRPAALYERWLRLFFEEHGCPTSGLEEQFGHAAALAWSLHRRGLVQEEVGSYGAQTEEGWFRRCPLRVHDYHPESLYSFTHKSLQEYLVARQLFQWVRSDMDTARAAFSAADLMRDFAVLRFFSGIHAGEGRPSAVEQALMTFVLDSRGTVDWAVKRCAANSISLLNALRIPFSGLDLSGIQVPQACLQCANLYRTTLRGACLRGAELKGAVLDYADLRKADVEGVVVGELLAILEGHTAEVSCVAVSCDGRFVVSGSHDRTLRIWDAQKGQLAKTLHGHGGGVMCVTVWGDTVVSGGRDNVVRLWGIETGSPGLVLSGHTFWVSSVAASVQNGLLASAAYDETVRVWQGSTGFLLHTLRTHIGIVFSVGLSADGTLLLSGGADHRVLLWDTGTGAVVQELSGHNGAVHSVALSPDGVYAVTGSADQTCQIWQTQSGKLLRKLEGHSAEVTAVAISSDAAVVASGSPDKTIRISYRHTGKLINVLADHSKAICSLAISPENSFLVSACNDHGGRLFRLHPGPLLQRLDGHTEWVSSLAITPDQSAIVSASGDKTLRIWDRRTGELLNVLEGHTGDVSSVAVAADHILSGSFDRSLRVWSYPAAQLLRTLKGHTNLVTSVAMSSDGALGASGSDDRAVCVWDLNAGKLLAKLTGHSDTVHSVAMSADGAVVASGSKDRTIRVWRWQTGDVVHRLDGHTAAVLGIAMSPDATLMMSASGDQSVRLWDLLKGRLLREFRGHKQTVWCVAASAAWDIIASGSSDTTVRIWPTAAESVILRRISVGDGMERMPGKPTSGSRSSGRIFTLRKGHLHTVHAVAVAADGSFIVSGSRDKTIRVWVPAPDSEEGLDLITRWRQPPVLQTLIHEVREDVAQVFAEGLRR